MKPQRWRLRRETAGTNEAAEGSRRGKPQERMKLRREAEPELYISDEDKAAGRAKDKAAGKPKDKGEKPAGEKIGRATTNFDEASLIVVSPVVLFL